MLELLLVFAVMALLVWKFEAHHFQQARSQTGLDPSRGTPMPPRPAPRLAIEGTQRPRLPNTKFLKGYGVTPQTVRDLRVYAHFGPLEMFPRAIVAKLTDIHAAGRAIGTDIMELLFHGRPLREGEAIYFALVENGGEPQVFAFVDRLQRG